jgi:hypothetical protein
MAGVTRRERPDWARRDPILEPDVSAGQVVVTRFECPSILSLLLIRIMHVRLRFDVRRQASGFVGVKALIDWRRRTLLSISLWEDLESVRSMGAVPRHVRAVRVPHGMGVNTASGIFCFVGDWRRVMFASDTPARCPLHRLPAQTPDDRSERKEHHV